MKGISRATGEADAEEISRLILSLVDVFVADPIAAQDFLHTLSPKATFDRLSSKDFDYWVVRSPQGAIDGVIGVRSKTHLYHLFASRTKSRCGIGTELWNHAQSELQNSIMTVNASVNALPFYEKLGLVTDGPEVRKDGLAFQPMSIKRPAS